MKFRKKSVVVDAIQYLPDASNGEEIVTFAPYRSDLGHLHALSTRTDACKRITIQSQGGNFWLNPGNWLIQHAEGSFSYSSPDAFTATYEPAAPVPASGPLESHEVCLCAAVQMPDGYIVRGHRHADALQTAGNIPRYKDVRLPLGAQGFLTSRGRFVGRVEGCSLQRLAGIDSIDSGQEYLNGELYSEDLY